MSFFFLLIFMYATWSSTFSFAKLALEHCPPLFLTASRMLLAAGLLLGFLAYKNMRHFIFNKNQLFILFLLGISSIYLTNACEFWSLQYLSAAKTCFIYSLCPFFSAIFSYWHFNEKMNWRKYLGMGIGFIGFIPVLISQKGATELLTELKFISYPELAMILAAVCTSYGWVLLRKAIQSGISPLMANGMSMCFGGILSLLHSFMFESWNSLPFQTSAFAPFAQNIILMTLISNILCYNLYGVMLKRFTATFVSFAGLLSPFFASLNAWFFLNEPPSLIIFVSTIIVSGGLWLIYSAELKQGYMLKSSLLRTQDA